MSGRIILRMNSLSHILSGREHRRAAMLASVCAAAFLAVPGVMLQSSAQPASAVAQEKTQDTACAGDNGGITLSPGFCATIFADNLGHVRHMAVAPNGVLYVNTWSGGYYDNDTPPAGGFLIALKDSKGDGHADVIERFGDGVAQGSAGGTGIAFYKDALYAEENDKILRYRAADGLPSCRTGNRKSILSGLPLTGDHPMHPFIIDARRQHVRRSRLGDQFLPGRRTACQLAGPSALHRTRDARRHLALRRQQERPEFLAGGALCDRAAQRRRLRLRRRRPALRHAAWPRSALAELAASSIRRSKAPNCRPKSSSNSTKGADFGWPECYFDGFQKKLVLAPEYGGDGGKTVGVCAEKKAPVASFPRIGRRTIC